MNRVDLRNLDQGNAGQGNFVFGLLENGNTQQAVVMFEYKLPAATEADVVSWAQSFHALAALPLGSEAYNAALQAIGTCDGCHSMQETGTFFQHIANQTFEPLSPFLRGGTVTDPITQETRTFNDLLRRRQDLEAIVCPPAPTVSLRHGIARVHGSRYGS